MQDRADTIDPARNIKFIEDFVHNIVGITQQIDAFRMSCPSGLPLAAILATYNLKAYLGQHRLQCAKKDQYDVAAASVLIEYSLIARPTKLSNNS